MSSDLQISELWREQVQSQPWLGQSYSLCSLVLPHSPISEFIGFLHMIPLQLKIVKVVSGWMWSTKCTRNFANICIQNLCWKYISFLSHLFLENHLDSIVIWVWIHFSNLNKLAPFVRDPPCANLITRLNPSIWKIMWFQKNYYFKCEWILTLFVEQPATLGVIHIRHHIWRSTIQICWYSKCCV